jgi:hypothetical protein
MKNTKVILTPYSEMCTIEVNGIINGGDEIMKILKYFESESESGGGTVLTHDFDDSKTEAHFMFESYEGI